MRATCAALVLLLASVATAAPPTVPAELKCEVGKPSQLTVKVEAGKKVGTAKTFDPAAMVFVRLWSDDPSTYEYLLFPNADGTFYVPFWTSGETDSAVMKVVVGKGGTKPPPTPDPQPDPKPEPTTKKHFQLVRPDGPISPAFESWMQLAAWKDVTAAGHTFADIPAGSLPAEVKAKFGTQPLPYLLTWNYTGDGKRITLPDGATAGKVPTTDAEIRGLLK